MATVARDLRVLYRLATTLSDVATNAILPGTDADEPRVVVPVDKGSKPFPVESLRGTPGAYVNPTIYVLDDQAVGLHEPPYSDIYYRIWVVPSVISVQNPALLTDIPFVLWSAWNKSNQLTTITPTGATGLTLDLSAPVTFNPVEQRTVNLQVTAAAPATVHATWLFTFQFGSGLFTFDAVLLEWIRQLPEAPVVEVWEWLTNIITAWKGSEQRIGARRQPRRRLEYRVLVRDDADRRLWYNRLAQYLGTQLLVPFFQYYTVVTQTSSVGATKIFFDPAKTDFRDDEYAVVFRPSDETSYVLRLTTVVADGANLASSLTFEVRAGDHVVPAFFGHLDEGGAIVMGSVAGEVPVGAFILDFRTQFNRPGSAAVIETFDGLNVLDRRPVVTNTQAQERFSINPHLVDSLTGKYANKVSWLHPYVGGGRQFVAARKRSSIEMDYWRDFLTAASGSRVPFLMSTWREDLMLAVTPPAGALQVEVEGHEYALDYFPHDTYKRFVFTNPDGVVIYRKAADAETQPDQTTLVTLESALPVTGDWAAGFEISYLNRVRLGDDVVRLTHDQIYTTIDLSVRTTDQ